RGQPADPPGVGVHRPPRPEVGSDRRAGLSMRVSDIMTEAAVSDQADDTLAEAARKMWEQQTGSLIVMEGEDLAGIITERDILKAVATGTELEKTRVEDVMVRDLVTIHPAASLRAAASVMTDQWVRHLP